MQGDPRYTFDEWYRYRLGSMKRFDFEKSNGLTLYQLALETARSNRQWLKENMEVIKGVRNYCKAS